MATETHCAKARARVIAVLLRKDSEKLVWLHGCARRVSISRQMLSTGQQPGDAVSAEEIGPRDSLRTRPAWGRSMQASYRVTRMIPTGLGSACRGIFCNVLASLNIAFQYTGVTPVSMPELVKGLD